MLIDDLLYNNGNCEMAQLLAPELRRATIVRADNIARYAYLEASQEGWSLATDFPNLAPVFDSMWVEYQIPMSPHAAENSAPNSLRGKTVGVLVVAHSGDEIRKALPLLPEHIKVWSALVDAVAYLPELREWYTEFYTQVVKPLYQRHPMRLIEHIPRIVGLFTQDFLDEWRPTVDGHHQLIIDLMQPARWVLGFAFFFRERGEPVSIPTWYQLPLDEHGAPFLNSTGDLALRWTVPFTLTEDIMTVMNTTEFYLIAFLALCFMHCKNVEVVTRQRQDKKSREQAVRANVGLKYKELIIEPMRKILADAGAESGAGLSRAMHIVRGHFADYRDHGLFGKHKNIFWFDMHVRGDAKQGVIQKSYNVQPEENSQ